MKAKLGLEDEDTTHVREPAVTQTVNTERKRRWEATLTRIKFLKRLGNEHGTDDATEPMNEKIEVQRPDLRQYDTGLAHQFQVWAQTANTAVLVPAIRAMTTGQEPLKMNARFAMMKGRINGWSRKLMPTEQEGKKPMATTKEQW